MAITDQIYNSPIIGYAELNVGNVAKQSGVRLTVTRLNKRLEEISNKSSSEIINKPLSHLFPDLKTDAHWSDLINDVLSNGNTNTYKNYFSTLNKVLNIQLWSDNAKKIELLITDTDLETAPPQKRKDSQIEDLNFVFDNLPQSIFVIEVTDQKEFKIIDFNRTQLDYLNMERNKVQGKFFHEIFPDDVTEKVKRQYNRCLQKRTQITYEENVEMPGLNERTYLTTLTPVVGPDGRVLTIVGNSVDITVRKEAEKALIREQKFNEALLETATDGIIACDENGKLVLFNQAAKRWHGKEMKPISVKDAVEPYDLYHFDGKTPLEPHEIPLQRAYEGETINNEEIAIKATGQPIRYLSTAGSPVLDKQGNKIGAVVIMRDITETLAQREALKKSEQRFKTLAYNTPGVIYLCENDDTYSMNFINDQVEALTGYPAKAFINKKVSFIELYHPEDEEKIYTIVENAISQKESFQLSYRLRHRSGKWKWVLETGIGIYNDEGELIQIEGYLTDITQQREAEELAHIANQQLSFHLQNSPLAVIVSDENFKVKEWSKSAEELFGWTEEEVLQMNNEEWKFTHEDDQALVNKKIRELILGDKPRNLCVNRNFTKDGRILHCEWYNSVMFDSRGKIISIFSLVHDISDRIEKEKELEDSLKEKNILLAEIHHRVKNNLAVVSGMMQLQAFETDNETLQDKLFDSVVRIKSIASVHEILYQSNSFSDLNFSDTVEKLVENISSTLQTTVPVEIIYDTDPINLDINKAIPAALVINEVVTNAYKHAFTNNKQGKISFTIRDTNGAVEIVIKDNGKGIEDAEPENNQSLGMQLIREISSQIYGKFTYRKVENGTEFRLSFER